MSTINYRGYPALVDYDPEDRIFVGRLAGIDDIVVFHGTTVNELETAFHEIVDHYLEVSERRGIPAQEPATQTLTVHVPPDVYAAVTRAAELEGASIDNWAARRLGEAARS